VYDTSGRLVRYRLGNLLRDLTYDAGDRITSYSHYDATTGAAQPSLNQSFGYDENGRLTSVTTWSASWSIGYDGNGNRTGVTLNGSASTYATEATSNRLSSITNPVRSFGYDAAGNTTSDSANYTSTYDASNRLQTLTKSGVTTTYSYNALGQRVRKFGSSGASSTNVFVYDLGGQLIGEYSSTGAVIKEYVWLGSTPIAMFLPNGANPPTAYYFHADHLNMPRVATDTSNNLRWRWLAKPFGATVPEDNPSNLGAVAQNLRFPGQYFDQESGLHYNWHRYYDPAGGGRYITSDPIGLAGGINTYTYSFNSPAMFIDPDGLDAIPIVFPDYMVQTPIGRQQLGHAGILLIDPRGGTNYYEYGRYADNNCGCGSVRTRPVPRATMGANGRPTPDSLQRVLAAVSRQAGHGGRIAGAYVPNDQYRQMNEYAMSRMRQNSNPNREPYNLFTNNCADFMLDVLGAGGVDTPWIVNPSPPSVINNLRRSFEPVDYVPR
jgi:RHS repeat-associated protein